MGAVVDPGPARLNELAGRNHRGVSDEGDQLALASRLDPQHAKTVLGVMECDAVDQAGQGICRACRYCPRHSAMMNVKLPGDQSCRSKSDRSRGHGRVLSGPRSQGLRMSW